jgi:hypothetical protein
MFSTMEAVVEPEEVPGWRDPSSRRGSRAVGDRYGDVGDDAAQKDIEATVELSFDIEEHCRRSRAQPDAEPGADGALMAVRGLNAGAKTEGPDRLLSAGRFDDEEETEHQAK